MDPSNWQTQLSTIRERNEYAFNKSLFCDVEFSVADSNGVKVTIPANKYVLAISSPVFEAMFYGGLAESRPIIDLPDCTKEGLQEMLRYVYSDEVNLTGSNIVMEVLYLADKYMMPSLKEKCKNYIGPEDVLSVLPEVERMGDEKLQEHLWKIVDYEAEQTLSSKSLLNVSKHMLCQILVRDTLHINELNLFHAVDRWVEERIKERGLESNGETKRSILGEEVIRLIRFQTMRGRNFSEDVLPCGILDKNELTELVQIFHEVTPATNIFNKTARCLVGGVLQPSVRFGTIHSPNVWNYKGKKDAISFTTNKAVYLYGVRMFGSQGSKYNVDLNIYRNEHIILQQSLTGESKLKIVKSHPNHSYYGFTAKLDQFVRIQPTVVYTVEAKITGPPSYYGESGKRSIPLGNDVTITYEYTMKSENGTTPKEGQFPRLVFHKI